MQKKHWQILPADANAPTLAESLKLSPIIGQVLINRGLTTTQAASAFINPKLTDLIEPARMPGMHTAVERIIQAVHSRRKITIYGDYDVDGITGIAILWHMLKLLGADVDYYIPHRIEEGYGLNSEAVQQLADAGSTMLITVDCGITAIDAAHAAAAQGLELVITDHHQLPERLPAAAAIVHPLLDGSYGNPRSCGALVAFKLAWALAQHCQGGPRLEPPLRQFLLDATVLAALGTVADVMELVGENRVIASYGLKAMTECRLAGLAALLESADLSAERLDSYHICFRLAPMLNAAGRMGHARLAVELLTADSPVHCRRIADYLKHQNQQRQRYEKKIFSQARQLISSYGLDSPDRSSIVLASNDWHSGVIGIVASRITENYHRPAVLISTCGRVGQGSARSIQGFDILKALTSCSQYLVSFGGHSMAAGLRIEPERLSEFTEAFEAYAKDNLPTDRPADSVCIDALLALRQLDGRVVKQLGLLEPFGQGNPRPTFATRGVRLLNQPRRLGTRSEHLAVAVGDSTGSVRCIGFGMAPMEKKLLEQDFFNIAYYPQINSYNGAASVEFVLADIQFE
jgi:single-stranded-DNA-specific exonuclease